MREEKLLDLAEVAKRVNKSVETVRRWVRSKKLRAVNLGGSNEGARYGVRDVDLDSFLAERSTR